VTAHLGIVLALLATVVYSLGFILEKRALTDLPPIDAHHFPRLIRTLFTAPAWLAGFVLICGGLALQVVVLSLEPLTITQPIQASGLVFTIVFSQLMLHERLGRAELSCIGVMAVAVVLLTLSSGHGPGGTAGTHASGGAVAAAAAPAFLASLLIYAWTATGVSDGRHRYPVTGVSYSLGSGLLYGVSGLALKALSAAVFTRRGAVAGHHSLTGLVRAAAASPYLYLALGALAVGMVIFQTALQRGKASVVIPVSTIISTGYLVLIGSWLFHERLPAGLVPLAMRLGGGIAAIAVPVILTIASERAGRRPAADPAPGSSAGSSAGSPAIPPARPTPVRPAAGRPPSGRVAATAPPLSPERPLR
jgi:drug/metabolite transporter (DMT)-like permease